MSLQSLFDDVANHLLNQSKKSVNDLGDPACRGVDGTMCAVGCLIPDELFDPKLNLETSTYIFQENPAILKYIIKKYDLDTSEIAALSDTRRLIGGLLKVHDMNCTSAWPAALAELAKTMNLEFKHAEPINE